MAAVKIPTVTQNVGRNDDDDIEEDLLDVQADIWMSFATAMASGGIIAAPPTLLQLKEVVAMPVSEIISRADTLTEAYMDRFKNGLPGQEPLGSRSEPPLSPVKGRDPKAGDDD